MSQPHARVRSIEDYLDFLLGTEGRGANVSAIETVPDFEGRVERATYWQYIDSADYHYFVARVLFLRMVYTYAFFCGCQCVENYLKAYLKWRSADVPPTHRLARLLDLCRATAGDEPDFINSRHAALIARRFDPFYELARYPVWRTGPQGGTYEFLHPDDILVLDYFVYRMRRILTVPENTWDIFREGGEDGIVELYACKQNFPDFYSLFKWNNINFPAKQTGGDAG